MSCDRQHNSCRHNNVDLQKHTDIDIQSDNNIDLQLACHEHEPHDTTYTQKGTAFKMKDSVQAKHPQLDTVYDKTIYNKTVNDSSIDSLQSNDSFNPLFQQTTILPLNKVNVVLPICLNNNFVQNNKIQESDPNKAIKIMKQSSSVRVENIPLEIVKDTLMESFHCTLCQLEFSSDLILTHHMKTSHKYATYSCIFCGKSFTYKHNLKIHQRNKHNRTTVLCSYCGKLVLQTRLDVHMEKVHEKPLFTCHICQKGFLKRECLEGHVNKHCNTKPYICEFCGRKYAYSTSLCSHKKRCVKASMPTHLQHPRSIDKKGTSYICEICGVKFEGISGLKDHLGAKHSNKSQHCSFCAKSFQWRPSYNRHVKKCKDRTELERERCKHLLCDKFGGKQFVCVCGKQYPYRQSYRRHERNCHQKQEMESYMTDPPVG
uniref:C2H2-type domain-containing protein n=1 Tax=Arion vulgaris TaxID=1028688 RepID=A0A0B6ZWV7_9EUPU